jgi:hypothetical protein
MRTLQTLSNIIPQLLLHIATDLRRMPFALPKISTIDDIKQWIAMVYNHFK